MFSQTCNTILVGRDGSAFDADVVLLNSLSCIDGDLIVGLVAILNAQIVILQINVQVGQDKLMGNVL